MKAYNIIALFDVTGEKLLLCKRRKEPFMGLLNLVGGKVEPGEDGLAAAYRELQEETGVTQADATITHLADFTYPFWDCRVEAYAGRLRTAFEVVEEENELIWSSLQHDFSDVTQYAGHGKIAHILELVKVHKDVLFNV